MSGEDVRHLPHYAGAIQPIDFCRATFTEEEYRGACKQNVIKYVSRFQDKDGLRDLEKARVYLDWLIQQERERLGLSATDPREASS